MNNHEFVGPRLSLLQLVLKRESHYIIQLPYSSPVIFAGLLIAGLILSGFSLEPTKRDSQVLSYIAASKLCNRHSNFLEVLIQNEFDCTL